MHELTFAKALIEQIKDKEKVKSIERRIGKSLKK